MIKLFKAILGKLEWPDIIIVITVIQYIIIMSYVA